MTTRTPRLHDIASLKGLIKTTASGIRDARTEARTLTGEERQSAKEYAKEGSVRYYLLAYGYLRGRTIEQMESLYTLPDNLPDASWVISIANEYFMEGPKVGSL